MAKQKSFQKDMVMSNEKLVLLGIAIGFLLAMLYVNMTSSKENIDVDVPIETLLDEVSTPPPDTTFPPNIEAPVTTFPPIMEVSTQPPVTTLAPSTDGSTPTSFKKWATLAVGKKQVSVKKFPRDWVKQRTKCQKSGNTFSEYSPKFLNKLINRSKSQLGGECWDVNNNGQTTHLCCNFKV